MTNGERTVPVDSLAEAVAYAEEVVRGRADPDGLASATLTFLQSDFLRAADLDTVQLAYFVSLLHTLGLSSVTDDVVRRVAETAEAQGFHDSVDTHARNVLAALLLEAGHDQQAGSLLHTLPANRVDDTDTAVAQANLAAQLLRTGAWTEARDHAVAAVALAERIPSQHRRLDVTLLAQCTLTRVAIALGDTETALRHTGLLADICQELLNCDHPQVLGALTALAALRQEVTFSHGNAIEAADLTETLRIATLTAAARFGLHSPQARGASRVLRTAEDPSGRRYTAPVRQEQEARVREHDGRAPTPGRETSEGGPVGSAGEEMSTETGPLLTQVVPRSSPGDGASGIGEHPSPGPSAPPRTELTPYLAPLATPPVIRPAPAASDEITTVGLRCVWVRLHPQLPPTLRWGYEGCVPGPTFEVRAGQRVRVAWTNQIPESSEYPITIFRGEEITPPPSPYFVTCLHGARPSDAGNDSWPESLVPHGASQLTEYANAHLATQWWYHDRAQGQAATNVLAGLYGMYVIRDDEEDALRLPSGKREIPLVLSEVSLDTDEDGRTNGRLTHQLPGPSPSSGISGPYTTVNGRIWPYLEVDDTWYRFRVVNASPFHVHTLDPVDERGTQQSERLQRIGGDGGLLPRAQTIPRAGVVLAPGERVDLLADFRGLAGRRLRLSGTKHLLEIRVRACKEADPFEPPRALSSSSRRLTSDIERIERLVVIAPPRDEGSQYELWAMDELDANEAERVRPGAYGVVQLSDLNGRLRVYRRITSGHDGQIGFTVAEGAYEQWSFLNLSRKAHPMNIERTEVQVAGRHSYDTSGFAPAQGSTLIPLQPTLGRRASADAADSDWRDVFLVPPGQLVSVMVRFTETYGRFLCHSQDLELADLGLSLPFVVRPVR